MKKKIIWGLGLIVLVGGILFLWGHFKSNKLAGYNDELQCNIVGKSSNVIKVFDKAKDNKYTITNVSNDKESYSFTMNDKNRGGLVGLADGKYLLKRNNEEEYYFIFNEFNHSYRYDFDEMSDALVDRGALLVTLVDENEEPLPGVTFDLYDENNKKVNTFTTEEDGNVALINLFDYHDRVLSFQLANKEDTHRFYVQIGKNKISRVDLMMIDGVVRYR